MAVTKITVDGVPVLDLTTPVKVTLSGNGEHKIEYTMDTDTIKKEAFKNCDIEKVTVPHTITKIKENAFTGSRVTEVKLQGKTKKDVALSAIPQGATLIASHEATGYTNFNVTYQASKTNDFQSPVPVGSILFERGDGSLYANTLAEDNSHTPIGVCVIPRGLFDNRAHFISLENIAYDSQGNVIRVTDHYNQYCMFGPRYLGELCFPGIRCYSQMPYIGKLYHTGEYDEPIYYNNVEEMPDILSTNRPSGNSYYTEATEFRLTYDLLGTYDWSDKSHTHYISCCEDGNGDTVVLPGSVSAANPYYKGSMWPFDSIRPIKAWAASDAPYYYGRRYYAPSPYLQVSDGDDVTANPVLLKELAPSPELSGDRGNPFRFYGSANEFLIPQIINKCVKPDMSTYNGSESEPFKYGIAENGNPTFFPAPYCCWEYDPTGSGSTKGLWALGTPLEWACAFAKIQKILNVLTNLNCPLGGNAADLIQERNMNDYHDSDSGWYWGGLFSNEGMVFLMDGNMRRIENNPIGNLPRLSTRPFITLS